MRQIKKMWQRMVSSVEERMSDKERRLDELSLIITALENANQLTGFTPNAVLVLMAHQYAKYPGDKERLLSALYYRRDMLREYEKERNR